MSALVSHFVRRAAGAALLAALGLPACHHFQPLQADVGRNEKDGALARATPYLSTLSYYGMLAAPASPASSEADANAASAEPAAPSPVVSSMPSHAAPASAAARAEAAPFVYFWLAQPQEELAIRVVAPARCVDAPKEHDVVEAGYSAHARADGTLRPCVRLERCTVGDGTAQGCTQWLLLSVSEHAAAGPCEGARESNLRIVANASDPAFALGRGAYRVQVARCEEDHASGPFFLQLAAPRALAPSSLSRTIAQLRVPEGHEAASTVQSHVPSRAEQPFALPVPDNLAPSPRSK